MEFFFAIKPIQFVCKYDALSWINSRRIAIDTISHVITWIAFDLNYDILLNNNIHQIIVSVCILTILMQKFILPSSWFGHAMNTKLHETVSNQCMCYEFIQQAMGNKQWAFGIVCIKIARPAHILWWKKKYAQSRCFINSYLYPKQPMFNWI